MQVSRNFMEPALFLMETVIAKIISMADDLVFHCSKDSLPLDPAGALSSTQDKFRDNQDVKTERTAC